MARTKYTPTHCAYLYLFLSSHCKFEPSRMQVQQLTNERPVLEAWCKLWLADYWVSLVFRHQQPRGNCSEYTDYTPHTFQRVFSGLFLAVVFNSLHFEGFFPPIKLLSDTVYILANVQLCKPAHDYLKIWHLVYLGVGVGGSEGATRCCRPVVLRSYWTLNIQWLVGRRWYRRELNAGDRV